MFWLRRWSYLILSSSSTLLLNFLIFSQWCLTMFCFLIGCIQQFHWLIIVSNNFFRFEVEFFSTPKKKKNPVQGKEIIVFLVGAHAQSCRKISEVDSGAFMATIICNPGWYTRKILSAVMNSQNVLKTKIKESKIKRTDIIWALDTV